KQLEELIENQELLQKKVMAAEQIRDPDARQAELQRLAREQEKLERLTRELAQRLNRTQGEGAGDELKHAAREMKQARDQLESGEPAGEKITGALERLDE